MSTVLGIHHITNSYSFKLFSLWYDNHKILFGDKNRNKNKMNSTINIITHSCVNVSHSVS